MLDLTIGEQTNALAAKQLIELLKYVDWIGSLYIGYPLLASADETILIDALLTCEEHGVIVFHFCEVENLYENKDLIRRKQDELFTAVDVRFRQFRSILDGRKLPFEIQVVSIVPGSENVIQEESLIISGQNNLLDTISKFPAISEDILVKINSSIQRLTTLKPIRKRSSVTRVDSRGAILKSIESGIANLDQWQKKGAIESPNGVQRIRGLAGSGKTIILALKAAYLHTAHPDWDIVITFHTRALSQQLKNLIRRFTFEHINDEPDWDKLKVIHTWGSPREPGVYSDIALAHDFTPRDFAFGKESYTYEHAFEGVCSELIKKIGDNFRPQFDAILIDEAQDLPQSFFELVFLATKDPKRIIYAYDELQNLSDYSMAPPEILFGKNADGDPRVPDLPNAEGYPKQDIVLPICYRNTSWALSVAHALGFGIYREEGLVQFFDNPGLLTEVGYETLSGNLDLGNNVTLRRREDSSPNYFKKLDPSDAILFKVFENKFEQAKSLALSIKKDLTDSELEYQDILVIISDPLTSRTEAGILVKELNKLNIPSHLAGVTSSRDQLFFEDSIAITNIYRAKGNEASMVYIINADYSFQGLELEKRRNILFTAITRSKAWVRVFGCGSEMEGLIKEANKVVNNNFEFKFKVPTSSELQALRRIHRDRTPDERKEIKTLQSNLKKFIKLINDGDLAIENLPEDLRKAMGEISWGDFNED